MNNPNNFTMEEMKADVRNAGNLFYQYRACRRDTAIIYDIENIRMTCRIVSVKTHGVQRAVLLKKQSIGGDFIIVYG